jgi:hypothetical protein
MSEIKWVSFEAIAYDYIHKNRYLPTIATIFPQSRLYASSDLLSWDNKISVYANCLLDPSPKK